MEKIDLKNYLFHGIVDWVTYDTEIATTHVCMDKLESILRSRYLYRPYDFKKNGITHNDVANPYTYFFTFVACHPDSVYATRFKKDQREDNGYAVATDYSSFGLLLDPKLLEELPVCEDVSFCDKEILIEGNISLDKYGLGIYINPNLVSKELLEIIIELLKKYQYTFPIINILDGSIIVGDGEKAKVFTIGTIKN